MDKTPYLISGSKIRGFATFLHVLSSPLGCSWQDYFLKEAGSLNTLLWEAVMCFLILIFNFMHYTKSKNILKSKRKAPRWMSWKIFFGIRSHFRRERKHPHTCHFHFWLIWLEHLQNYRCLPDNNTLFAFNSGLNRVWRRKPASLPHQWWSRALPLSTGNDRHHFPPCFTGTLSAKPTDSCMHTCECMCLSAGV